MQSDIKLMLKIFQTYELDWMGDEIKELRFLTKHHIVKKEKGGYDELSNYALLTPESHQLLHYLEDTNYKAYCRLNELFIELNSTLKPPTAEYYKNVREVIVVAKKQIKNKRRKRRSSRGR